MVLVLTLVVVFFAIQYPDLFAYNNVTPKAATTGSTMTHAQSLTKTALALPTATPTPIPTATPMPTATPTPIPTAVPTKAPTAAPTTAPAPKPNGPMTCNDLSVLVDKTYALSSTYAPPDLVYLKDNGIPVTNNAILGRSIIISQLQKMYNDITSQGIDLRVLSAYRSYSLQTSIYYSYVQQYGQAAADTFSARPGHSQHQLGTAVDFTTSEIGNALDQSFGNTRAGKWLAANAYKYGFYISYPNGQDAVTGYEYEPWHFRYLGVETATAIQQSGLIMQTYLQQHGELPNC